VAPAAGSVGQLWMYKGMRRVGVELVTEIIRFWQKQSLTHSFYGSPPPLTFLDPDRWVQREGYGGPNSDEKSFQLFSILVQQRSQLATKEGVTFRWMLNFFP
jgi:hypothetical protein